MGIVKRAADLAYAFRFVKLMTTPFENTDAYKLGIIDKDGKRIRSVKLDNDEKKSAYTPFMRLAYNIKRIISNLPGGSSAIGGFASALFLIKEQYGLEENQLRKIIKALDVDELDLMRESHDWFVLEDQRISPGIYRVRQDKLINETFDDLVKVKDKVRISEDCYPVGSVFGIDIYEATHMNTNRKVFITTSEIYK